MKWNFSRVQSQPTTVTGRKLSALPIIFQDILNLIALSLRDQICLLRVVWFLDFSKEDVLFLKWSLNKVVIPMWVSKTGATCSVVTVAWKITFSVLNLPSRGQFDLTLQFQGRALSSGLIILYYVLWLFCWHLGLLYRIFSLYFYSGSLLGGVLVGNVFLYI